MKSPFGAHLAARGYVVLDGGLATALEARGHDLKTTLWSARLLMEDPAEIRAVHDAYLRAGADCLVTASYQATLEGLARAGVRAEAREQLLRSSTTLALDAVRAATSTADGPRPLVAASVGPYGAWLADGSEYDGRYGLTVRELVDFHAPRLRILAASGADLLACETIPSVLETEALVRLLDDVGDVACWMTFTCADARTLRDGSPVEEAAALAASHPATCAVGINCTDPAFAGALVERIRAVTELPVVTYPNSGERYEPARKSWTAAGPDGVSWIDGCRDAWRAGARILGGCCRTGPEDIAVLRRHLQDGDWSA